MMIMFMIVATAALSVSGAVYAAVLTCLDPQHRLRSERLTPRAGNTKGVAPWVTAQCLKVRILGNMWGQTWLKGVQSWGASQCCNS